MMPLYPFKRIHPRRWQILESLASHGFRKWRSAKEPPKPMPKRLVGQGLLQHISNTRRRRRKPRSNVGRKENHLRRRDPDRIIPFTFTDIGLRLHLHVLQVHPSTTSEEGRPKPPLVEAQAVPSTLRELQARGFDPVPLAPLIAGSNNNNEELKALPLLPTTFKNSILINTFVPEKIGWAPPRLG